MDPSPAPLEETFNRYIDERALTQEELATARMRATEVADILRPKLRHEMDERPDHLVSGSVGKRTAIHPLPSVDVLYLLPADDAVIPLLQDALSASFATVIATPAYFCIPLGGVSVCIRPTIDRQGIYTIPIENGWVTSDPIAEMAALRVADSVSGGRTTRLLLLLKAWKMECGVPVSSFALEIMAREFMAEYGESPWAALLADFLAWSRQRTPAGFDLPGGAERLTVDANWHPQAESSYWRCVLASRHEASGDSAAALQEWRTLLGPRFGAAPKFNMWDVRPDIGQTI
jgi:hypothetical protein